MYLQDISHIKLLTADEEKTLARRFQNEGDEEAHKQLAEHHQSDAGDDLLAL